MSAATLSVESVAGLAATLDTIEVGWVVTNGQGSRWRRLVGRWESPAGEVASTMDVALAAGLTVPVWAPVTTEPYARVLADVFGDAFKHSDAAFEAAYREIGAPIEVAKFAEPPADTPRPAWAVDAGGWVWCAEVEVYERDCFTDVSDAVSVQQLQQVDAAGKVTFGDPEIVLLDKDALTGPEQARTLAYALLQAAEILAGPRPAGPQQQDRTGSTQYRVVQVIRARIKALPIGQNEVAIAAGYSPTELSLFMTGQRGMDLTDMENIAHALGVEPDDLVDEAFAAS